MVQTNEASLVCHATEAEPARSVRDAARSHRPTGEAHADSVETSNTATPVVPVRAGEVERAIEVVAVAGGGKEEGSWGGSTVRLNFPAACAGSCCKRYPSVISIHITPFSISGNAPAGRTRIVSLTKSSGVIPKVVLLRIAPVDIYR